MMTKYLWVFLMFAGTGLLSTGWFQAGYTWMGTGLVAVLLIALALDWKRVQGAVDGLFLLFSLAAAIGLWKGLAFSAAFAGFLLILAGWDLHGFGKTLALAAKEDLTLDMERKHIVRLGAVLFTGSGLTYVSFLLRPGFKFDWAVVLTVIVFAGIGTLVRRFSSR